jgi:2-succinyl-5-enolpyruvyl-6-hydroxy-3-cyclohexene-1-carboxylate synthase
MSEHTDPTPEVSPSTADVKAEALKPDSLSANEIPPSVSASTAIADPIQPSPVASRTGSPGDIPAASIAHNHFPPQAHPSKIDIWSTRLAAWAQIATVFVVVFGYLYTVRPVFQLQLLQEQTAQLQLDNASAKQRLDQTIAEQASAQTKLNALHAELASMAKSRDDLADRLNQESQREVQAMQKMANAQMKLSSQTGTLLLAQRGLLYSRLA